jgi:C4-dicarboxylate transporter DctQ subunit
MCFRFLQVAWSYFRTGELPHHDHGHVEGLEEESDAIYRMDDNLHPKGR